MDTPAHAGGCAVERMRFRRQWIVGAGAPRAGPEWQSLALTSGHTLCWHPEARIAVRQEAGRHVVVLGVATHTAASCDPLAVLGLLDRASVVRWLFGLAGRYVVLFCEGEDLYLYTDPAGMMGVFHSGAQAASAPCLLAPDGQCQGLPGETRRELEESFFPGTLCPQPGVSALMANHELHLNSGRTRRFWMPSGGPGSDPEAPGRLGALVGRIVDGFRASGQLLVSLSGGRDSRVSLAAARAFAAESRFFTIAMPRSGSRDAWLGRQLAVRLGLNHEVVRAWPAPGWVAAAWDEIGSGMCRASSRPELGAVCRIQARGCVHVGGVGGEVLRAHLWPCRQPKRADAASLTRQAFARAPAGVAGAVQDWRRSLPEDLPACTVFDLFEFEQRTGRTAGIVEACSCLFYETVSPFNSRELFDLVQRVPLETRFSGQLNAQIIRTIWPELLEAPFTQTGRPWWKSLPKSVKRALKGLSRLGGWGAGASRGLPGQ